MSLTLDAIDLQQLSVEERLDLIGVLWDSITETDPEVPLAEWHLELLAERIAAADADPGAGSPLEEVRARFGKHS
jgi:putative addiction module component (TIGR02574 family)